MPRKIGPRRVRFLPTSVQKLLYDHRISGPVMRAENGSPVVLHPPEQTDMPIEIHDNCLEKVGDRLIESRGTRKHSSHGMLESLPTIGAPLFRHIPNDAEDRLHRTVTGCERDERHLNPPHLSR